MEQMQAIVDCSDGQTTYVALTSAQGSAMASADVSAQAQDAADRAALALRRQQMAALSAVRALLGGPLGAADSAALGGLVSRLVADPPVPLSVPEERILLRFILRCLLP